MADRLTACPPWRVSPSRPPPPFPGLPDAVSRFLHALRTAGVAAALPHCCEYWVTEFRGEDNLARFLSEQPALLDHTAADLTPAIYDDEMDTALQPARLTQPPGPGGEPRVIDAVIHVFLERAEDGSPGRWAVAGFHYPDTS